MWSFWAVVTFSFVLQTSGLDAARSDTNSFMFIYLSGSPALPSFLGPLNWDLQFFPPETFALIFHFILLPRDISIKAFTHFMTLTKFLLMQGMALMEVFQ